MIYKYFIAVSLGCLVSFAMHEILKLFYLRRQNARERYRIRKIEHTFRQLSRMELIGKNSIESRLLFQLLQEYTMATKDYDNGIRVLNRIKRLSPDPIGEVIYERAVELLRERLILGNGLKKMIS